MEEGMVKPAELPKAHVLNYVAIADTPTRVRNIASTGVLVVGIVCLLITVAMMVSPVSRIVENAVTMHRWAMSPRMAVFRGRAFPGGVPSLWVLLLREAVRNAPVLAVFGVMVTVSAMLILCARGVRGGKPSACLLAVGALWAPALWMLLASVAIGGRAVVYGTSISGYRAESRELWWAAALLVTVPLLLLQFDLIRFLRWIAQNPIAEKPAMSFFGGEAPAKVPVASIGAAGTALPGGHILTYMTSVETPTRVKVVAATSLRICGIALAILLLPALRELQLVVMQALMHYMSGGFFSPVYSPFMYSMHASRQFGMLSYILEMVDPHGMVLSGLLLGCFFCALLMLVCAGWVRRGNVVACHLSSVAVAIPMVAVGALTVLMGVNSLANTSTGMGGWDLWQLVWFCTVPLGVLMILLLADVLRFVRWIARNPVEEGPRIGFLPAKA